MLSVGLVDRWWGPGWGGSMVLSNNARPIPALVFERMFTDPFRTPLLSWLGPWDLTVMLGELERSRTISNALFLGIRINFRPLKSLEIGLTRSAQLCGDDRPCDLETVGKLLLGKDNQSESLSAEREPGNQLAGVDLRWTLGPMGIPVAFYGQFMGEDEAGGLPSSWLGLAGIEFWGESERFGSYRFWLEATETTCQFYATGKPNCAYNHGIYRTGYRYRGRSIGHGLDNDAKVISAGGLLNDSRGHAWSATATFGELNRVGAPDTRNTVASMKEDYWELEFIHRRPIRWGSLDLGVGYDHRKDTVSSTTSDDFRVFAEWRYDY
jgi:hypothetical protein